MFLMCENHRFAFNRAQTCREQALGQFEASPRHHLADQGAPDELGVYALYVGDAEGPVYVGKATKITLGWRLNEHARRIEGRENVELDQTSCRYLVIGGAGEEWVAASADNALIEHYRPDWDGSGFSGHVPGEGRPGTRERRWDAKYPRRR